MNDCKKCSSLMGKELYGELKTEEKEFFNRHLSSCKECEKEFHELKNVLSLVETQNRQEPDEAFMNNFWDQLEPKLKKKPFALPVWWTNFVNSLRFEVTWKHQFAGALALLVIGIFIGEYLSSGQKTTTQYSLNDKSSIEQTAVTIKAANYIERSKVLILGLMNFDPATEDIETISLPKQREISRELLVQTAGLKDDLKNPSQQQLKKLVTDIELILLQIANLETKHDLNGIELIKDGVNTRGIILKINIEEMKKNSVDLIQHQNRNENKKI